MPNEVAVVPTVRVFAVAMEQQLLRRVGAGDRPLRTRLHANGLRSAAVGGWVRQTQTRPCLADCNHHARQDDQSRQRSAFSVHGALPAGLDAGSDTALLRSWRDADVRQRFAVEGAQTQLACHVGTKGEIHTAQQPTQKDSTAGLLKAVWEHAAVERLPTVQETTRSRKTSIDLHTSYKTQHRSGRLRGCSPPSVRPCFGICSIADILRVWRAPEIRSCRRPLGSRFEDATGHGRHNRSWFGSGCTWLGPVHFRCHGGSTRVGSTDHNVPPDNR